MNHRLILFLLAFTVALGLLGLTPGTAQKPEMEVKIGMLDTLFDEKEEKKILAQIEPFANLVRKKTQTKGTFGVTRGLDMMVEDLKADRLQMGVMHGLDYAWLKPRLPDAKPLLIAINETTTLKAVMVVPKDSPIKSLAELRDKQLSMGPYPPYHVRVWLNDVTGGSYDRYFKVREEKDVGEAIEEVADKNSAATALTGGALDFYKKDKPVRYDRFLRVLAESPEFPAPVMVYRPGKVKTDVLERFRNAMLTAHESEEGKDTLNLWRLKRFVEVPANYEQTADEIIKRYPPPK
jgi:ABC-type phosphate/phosphonate transport system substrate-binding protein